jgi:predicted metal-dependent HD superfamily phosphohydrolase
VSTEHLARRWEALWHGLDRSAPEGLLDALLGAWREPQRHYHTLQHLIECFAHFDAARALAHNPAAVELALWFHDSVYDVHAHDNEARSADWARHALGGAGLPAGLCDEVAALVMATSHAGVADTPDARLLTDIDLAILAAPPARFAEYERQIRVEYAHVPEAAFVSARRRILQGFLARKRLYATPRFFELHEHAARANLVAALASL